MKNSIVAAPLILTPGRLLRLKEVLKIVPVSKSTWWAGVKSGRFPAPVKLGPRVTAWRSDAIIPIVEQGA